MKLITHDGTFHADEVFSTAILSTLFPECSIQRTRNLSHVQPDDIVYDVGLEYDGENKFDHHQNDDSLQRENGLPYSSFGLIWKHFGHEYVAKITGIAKDSKYGPMIWEKFDRSLVQPIDADDNGFSIYMPDQYPRFTVSNVISNYNMTDTGTKEQLKAFYDAVDLAKGIIDRQLNYNVEQVVDYFKVVELITDDEVLVLPNYLRWYEAVKDTHIKYVIFPTQSEYRVRPTRLEYYFNPLDVERFKDHKDYVFCHKSGFLCGTKSTDLARTIIKDCGK